jgi:hypothetical protein
VLLLLLERTLSVLIAYIVVDVVGMETVSLWVFVGRQSEMVPQAVMRRNGPRKIGASTFLLASLSTIFRCENGNPGDKRHSLMLRRRHALAWDITRAEHPEFQT